VFDSRGVFVRRIGSKGQGPGELQNPNSIHLIGGRRLIFEDFIRGLNTFSLEGRFLGLLSTAGQMLRDVAVTPGNRIVARVNADPRGPGGKELRLYDDRFKPLMTLLAMPEEPGNPQVLKPFPAGFHMALDGDERAVVSFKEDYEIEVLDLRGGANKRITRKYDRIKIGKEEIDGAAKYARGRKVEAPERHQAVRGLSTDEAGRIYAATLNRAPEGKSLLYDVFDREGRYLAQVPVPPTAKSLVWMNRKLYCLDQDNEGLPMIKRYAVLWRIPD
jgi:hypothetical protein